MVDTISEIIKEQETTNKNLMLLEDTDETLNKILEAAQVSSVDSGFDPNKQLQLFESSMSTALTVFKDGVGDTISTKFVDAELVDEDYNDDSLALMKSMNSNLEGILTNSDQAEEAMEPAAIAVDRQNDGDAGKGFELGGLGGKLGKLAGKAGIIGAAAVATGMLVKSVFDGLTDDKLIKQITGKARGELTASEEAFAVISNVVGTLSFGLFSAEETFAAMLPLAAGFQKATDAIFDPETGVFSSLMMGMFKLLDGDLKEGISAILSGILDFAPKAIGLGLELLKDGAKALLGLFLDADMVGEISASIDKFVDPVIGLFKEDLPKMIQNMIGNAVNSLSKVFDGLMQLFDGDLIGGVGTIIGSLYDTINGIMGDTLGAMNDVFAIITGIDVVEKISTTFDSVVTSITEAFDTFLSIPEKIAEFFLGFASSITSFITDKISAIGDKLGSFGGSALKGLTSFFSGDDEKEKAVVQKTVQPVTPIEEVIAKKPEPIRKVVKAKPKPKRNRYGKYKTKEAYDAAINSFLDQDDDEDEGLFKPVVKNKKSNYVPALKAARLNSDIATKASKERFDDDKLNVNVAAPAPVIINNEKREKRNIIRKTESNDITLAMMAQG